MTIDATVRRLLYIINIVLDQLEERIARLEARLMINVQSVDIVV